MQGCRLKHFISLILLRKFPSCGNIDWYFVSLVSEIVKTLFLYLLNCTADLPKLVLFLVALWDAWVLFYVSHLFKVLSY